MAGGMQIASLFASIGADTSGLQTGLGKAKGALSTFGSSIAAQVVGMVSLTAAVGAAGKFVSSSVTDWADYADSMRLSAQMAGITTEEMSRLAQAGDDVRVPIETMQKSMEMALKNGFTPTIENLATLSDKLVAIEDPSERAAMASKIFGKSYADMMPFLLSGGDAIRGATDAIADNLIVTEEGAQAAKEYKDQVDELGDSWTGFKNTIGKGVIPVLNSLFNQITSSSSISDLREEVGDLALALKNTGQITKTEYNAIMKEAYAKNKTTAESTEYLTDELKDLNAQYTKTGAVVDMTAENMIAQSIAAAKSADAIDIVVESLSDLRTGLKNADGTLTTLGTTMQSVGEITSLTSNFSSIISLANQYDDILGQISDLSAERGRLIAAGWSETSAVVTEVDGKILGLQGTMTDLANQMTLDMFQATLAIGGVTEAELDAYFDMAIAMGLMSEDAAKAAKATFKDAIDTISGYSIEPITGEIFMDATNAYLTIKYVEQMKIADKNGNLNLFIKYFDDPNKPNWWDDNYDFGYTPKAMGGAVMGSSPYLVGERGPELFVPDSNGQIISNGQTNAMLNGGDNSALLAAIANIPTARDIARAVRDAVLMVAG